MGYYSDFSINILPEQEEKTLLKIKDDIEKASGYDFCLEGKNINAYHVKWYNYERNLKYISEKYPCLVFLIDIVGEENGDLMRGQFKDGEYELVKAQISFPPFKRVYLEIT